jgi:hypothetical protein
MSADGWDLKAVNPEPQRLAEMRARAFWRDLELGYRDRARRELERAEALAFEVVGLASGPQRDKHLALANAARGVAAAVKAYADAVADYATTVLSATAAGEERRG